MFKINYLNRLSFTNFAIVISIGIILMALNLSLGIVAMIFLYIWLNDIEKRNILLNLSYKYKKVNNDNKGYIDLIGTVTYIYIPKKYIVNRTELLKAIKAIPNSKVLISDNLNNVQITLTHGINLKEYRLFDNLFKNMKND